MFYVPFMLADFYDNIAVKRKSIKYGEYDKRVTLDKD